jgi:hypothetical protein
MIQLESGASANGASKGQAVSRITVATGTLGNGADFGHVALLKRSMTQRGEFT